MKKPINSLLVIFVLQLTNFVWGAIPVQERAALIAFYNSTNGNSWTSNAGWKTPPLDTDGFAMPGTEGTWQGVTVAADHVTHLILYTNNLSGSIPPELGNLGSLIAFEIPNNQVSGSIPSELSSLSNMIGLYLANNQLTGNIPPELGNLGNLMSLDLCDNQLSGTIPSQLGNLNAIQIRLSNNNLGGTIPSQLGNIDTLVNLDLEGNQLTGHIPSTLGNFCCLQRLSLDHNQLNGSIPSQLGNLSQMRYLYLNNNQLNSAVPSSFTNFTNINELDIGYNCLYAVGSTLRDWLNLHDPDWETDQNQCGADVTIPILTTNPVSAVTLTGAIGGGNVTADGNALVTSRGICWSTSTNPTIANSKTTAGSGTGSFTCNITGLNPGVKYYTRAFATNKIGTAYGANIIFTTLTTPVIPTVTTDPVSSITFNGAVCGGNAISDGGAPVTGKGVCWSTSANPTTANSKTIDGSGTGSFTSNITGLTPGTEYNIRAYATNSVGTAYGANIAFTTASAPEIVLNHSTLNFGAETSGTVTAPQTVLISNASSGALNWSASTDAPWLHFDPASGTGDSILSVSVTPTGLATGNYSAAITITDPDATNSPQTINVTLHVYKQGNTSAPFGQFATPQEGASVYNSIPVTGWVIDDIGAAHVKIYNGDTYIGDAVFVEGARPDVETAYPTYPNNYKAGWGYMLLTHFLPNGGNGTYTLFAKATDMEGNTVTLGSKTITIDNAHAVKPFGAIDTPTQGGTAAGNQFVNFGWALTPQPNSIPVDGSSITVVIDGLIKGHPKYNIYRSDIAGLFPGYANSNGAVGYYYIDTTNLKNGLHTISWNVSDNGGNNDGIGSRYFSVINTETDTASSAVHETGLLQNEELPGQNYRLEPVEELYPAEDGITHIEISELERLEINLSGETILGFTSPSLCSNPENTPPTNFNGYLTVGEQLKDLPTGSTLDKVRGVFYWQPGPGFAGEYCFLFIGKTPEGEYTRKSIVVNITPKK